MQGSNLGLLRWQVDSLPSKPPGKPLPARWCHQKIHRELALKNSLLIKNKQTNKKRWLSEDFPRSLPRLFCWSKKLKKIILRKTVLQTHRRYHLRQEVTSITLLLNPTGAWGLPWWLSGKNSPAMQEPQETRVQSLGRKDPLEEENGNLLQYSWLENPMDRGAWQATVHGVAESWTLKRLSMQHARMGAWTNFQTQRGDNIGCVGPHLLLTHYLRLW